MTVMKAKERKYVKQDVNFEDTSGKSSKMRTKYNIWFGKMKVTGIDKKSLSSEGVGEMTVTSEQGGEQKVTQHW